MFTHLQFHIGHQETGLVCPQIPIGCEQEAWQDAQDERKEILEQASIICQTISTDFDTGDQVDDAIDALLLAVMQLQHLRDEAWSIEEEFPAEYEPDWRDGE